MRLEQRTYGDPIIYSHTSRFQHIVMTRRNDRLSLFINGHLQFNSRDERIYHEMLVHVPFAVASSRARVLILGGGDGAGSQGSAEIRCGAAGGPGGHSIPP